jgi:glycine/D-amino acid oxidase-like deaminating enzyme
LLCKNTTTLSHLFSFLAHTHTAPASTDGPITRYAVLGGGFAGVAAAWHLLAAHTHTAATTRALGRPALTLYAPCGGLGAGGSGAAAGLLHPFAPGGAPLWQGGPAFEAAVRLVRVAEEEEEARRREGGWGGGEDGGAILPIATPASAMVRPAEDGGQASKWAGRPPVSAGGAAAAPLSAAAARAALPGLALPADGGEAAAWGVTAGGLVVHPARYLRALWGATVRTAAAAGGTATLDMTTPPITSLAAFDGESGPPAHAAIVVAAGAGTGTVAEARACGLAGCLDLVGGATADWRGEGGGGGGGGGRGGGGSGPTPAATPTTPTTTAPWPGTAALLGRWYAAPVPGGQGSVRVGATRGWADPRTGERWTAEAALAAQQQEETEAASSSDAAALASAFCAAWPPAAAWGPPSAVVRGVRALAPRSSAGRPPLAGRLDEARNWWAVAGLGARGLTYSAWVAALVAEAAVGGGGGESGSGSGGEAGLPAELTRWRRRRAA